MGIMSGDLGGLSLKEVITRQDVGVGRFVQG